MEDKHFELHEQCGRFEKEFCEFLERVKYKAFDNEASFAPQFAYVRMKVVEMAGHFDALMESVAAADLPLAQHHIWEIQTDLDFLCQDSDKVRAGLIDLANHLESHNENNK